MSKRFLDTNTIIRLLTGDDVEKQAAAARLFEQIQSGAATVYAPDTVIADAVSVLESERLHSIEEPRVVALLTPFVRFPHFRLSNRRTVRSALAFFGQRDIEFGDVMIHVRMAQQGSDSLYSFDANVDQILGIQRAKPKGVAPAAREARSSCTTAQDAREERAAMCRRDVSGEPCGMGGRRPASEHVSALCGHS